MNTPSPSDQLWLAKQLPEQIIINGGITISKLKETTRNHVWKDGNHVTPREWHYIVSLVEGNLNTHQTVEYMEELSNNMTEEFLDLSGASIITHAYMTLPLYKRAIALKQVLGE